MKKVLTKAICAKNIVFWSAVSCGCLIVLFTFAREFMQSMSEEQEIFIPGILAITAGVLLLLYFGVTRVLKYFRLYSVK